jgi:sn-1 stearoyl-lipid 9-desaturase
MAFLKRILEPPRYGFAGPAGEPVYPSPRVLLAEFFYHLNVFRDRKNWLPVVGWLAASMLTIPLVIFLRFYVSWQLCLVGFVYSMVVLGSHGTFYLHRYGTHRTFHIRNKFWIFICRNLVIKIVPEETYIISHHVHHRFSEKPGDPYNVHGGWLYCFLADANHQMISHSLSEEDYRRVSGLLSHTGMKANTYKQYLRWGSVASPLRTAFHYLVNWSFWYGTFFLIGGHALATAIFGASAVWAFGVRTFNYDGHGQGRDRRRDGIDFNREDLSINQVWPGYVAGEWHNNHHLFPNSARNGFLPYQLDLPWLAIWLGSRLGVVTSFKDDKENFLNQYIRKNVQLAPDAAAPTFQSHLLPLPSSPSAEVI